IGCICFAPCFGVRSMLINTVYFQPVELEDRSVPLGIPTCKVIVHRNDMYPFSGKGIQVGRKGSHKCFSLSCSHLSNFTFVQYDTANQLYVIVNHVPGYRCSGSHPGVLPDGLLSLNFDMWMQCSQFPVVVERADFQTFVLCEASGSFLDYSESLRQDL